MNVFAHFSFVSSANPLDTQVTISGPASVSTNECTRFFIKNSGTVSKEVSLGFGVLPSDSTFFSDAQCLVPVVLNALRLSIQVPARGTYILSFKTNRLLLELLQRRFSIHAQTSIGYVGELLFYQSGPEVIPGLIQKRLGDRDCFGTEPSGDSTYCLQTPQVQDICPQLAVWDFVGLYSLGTTDRDLRCANSIFSGISPSQTYTFSLVGDTTPDEVVHSGSVSLLVGGIQDGGSSIDDKLWINEVEIPFAFDTLNQGTRGASLLTFKLNGLQIQSINDSIAGTTMKEVRVRLELGHLTDPGVLRWNDSVFIDYVTLSLNTFVPGMSQ